MATLTKEYTDIKDIRHNVEHLVVPTNVALIIVPKPVRKSGCQKSEIRL